MTQNIVHRISIYRLLALINIKHYIMRKIKRGIELDSQWNGAASTLSSRPNFLQIHLSGRTFRFCLTVYDSKVPNLIKFA